MRLPCRLLHQSDIDVFAKTPLQLIGCLGFEERCIAAPLYFGRALGQNDAIKLLELSDPPDGVPDYSEERQAWEHI